MISRTKDPAPADWTLLLYIGAQDNQEPVDRNLLEEIAMETGQIDGPVPCLYQIALPDETLCGTFRNGKLEILTHGPKIDITDPKHLTSFVDWAQGPFPSTYTALFLKDHGTGWWPAARRAEKEGRSKLQIPLQRGTPAGIFLDGDRYMSIPSVRSAIEDTRRGKVEVYAFDACDMSAFEVAYEIRGVAKYMIATPSIEPEIGWPYARILNLLRTSVAPIEAEELVRKIVEYTNSSSEFKNAYLSGIRLNGVTELAAEIAKLAVALTADLDQLVAYARDPSNQGNFESIDMTTLLQALVPVGFASGDLGMALARLRVAGPPNPSGIDIFLPGFSGSKYLASYGSLTFAQQQVPWANVVSGLNQSLLKASSSDAQTVRSTSGATTTIGSSSGAQQPEVDVCVAP
jgi:hypothetical protein